MIEYYIVLLIIIIASMPTRQTADRNEVERSLDSKYNKQITCSKYAVKML